MPNRILREDGLPAIASLKTEDDVLRVRASMPRLSAGDPLQGYKWALAMRLRAIRKGAAGPLDHAAVKRMLAVAGSVCPKCAEPMLGWNGRSPSLDHKVSLARGGSNATSNLEIICNRCNSRKADRA